MWQHTAALVSQTLNPPKRSELCRCRSPSGRSPADGRADGSLDGSLDGVLAGEQTDAAAVSALMEEQIKRSLVGLIVDGAGINTRVNNRSERDAESEQIYALTGSFSAISGGVSAAETFLV